MHGLLRTLEAHELVAQDPGHRQVQALGPGVLQLGNAYLDGSDLRARSLRWAESLAQQAGEAVWVATLSGSRVIVLHHVFRPDNTVQILEVGATIPWHACALGHAIVANLQAAQRAQALAADLASLTGRTKTTRGALTRALTQVRGAGWTRSRTRRPRSATRASRRPSSAATTWWPARSAWSVPRTGCSPREPATNWSARWSRPPARSPATSAPAAAA